MNILFVTYMILTCYDCFDQEKHEKINRSQEALIHNLELKISDMEMRLAGLQQKTTEEDLSYKQKYMDTKRALEDLREDFNRIEKELTSNKREVVGDLLIRMAFL